MVIGNSIAAHCMEMGKKQGIQSVHLALTRWSYGVREWHSDPYVGITRKQKAPKVGCSLAFFMAEVSPNT